jgi:hypothetical protein
MSDVFNQVDTLLRSAQQMPRGTAQLGVMEEAMRIADVHQEPELGFWARRALMSVYSHLGMTERIAVVLAWCVARCDEDPERFEEERLLWPMKWPAENLVRFASVSRAQVEALHRDMEQRFVRHGASLRPLMMYRARAAMVLGDGDAATRRWLDEVAQHPRDHYSDCLACETNLYVEVLLDLGELEEALVVGAPILAGDQTCGEVPHTTLSQLIWPLHAAGRVEEARALHRRGWALVLGKQQFLREMAAQLDYLVMLGDVETASKGLERHARWAMETLDSSRQLAFWMSAEVLARRAGVDHARVPWRLPEVVPVTREADGIVVAELAAWSAALVDRLAAQYAARDGHDRVPERVAAFRARHEAARREAG